MEHQKHQSIISTSLIVASNVLGCCLEHCKAQSNEEKSIKQSNETIETPKYYFNKPDCSQQCFGMLPGTLQGTIK